MNVLAKWRSTRRLTQEELAVKASVGVATIRRIETGEVNASLKTLGSLAAALEVEVEELEPLRSQKPINKASKQIDGETTGEVSSTSEII